jgi:HEPN domain-containing protein
MAKTEPELRALVQRWINKAESDLRAARHLLQASEPFIEEVAFHSQQAAEKYVNAHLTQQQIEFPKTHDLRILLDLLAADSISLAQELIEVRQLTAYAVEARYPEEEVALSFADAQRAVELASLARDRILAALKSG